MADFLHEALTFQIIGAAMEVHRMLGPGFLESIYQRGMELELLHHNIPFEAQKRIRVEFRGEALGEHVLDLVVASRVVVELKAVKDLNEQHQAQTISYLRAARLPVGLLINFAKAHLEHKRILLKDAFRLRSESVNPSIR